MQAKNRMQGGGEGVIITHMIQFFVGPLLFAPCQRRKKNSKLLFLFQKEKRKRICQSMEVDVSHVNLFSGYLKTWRISYVRWSQFQPFNVRFKVIQLIMEIFIVSYYLPQLLWSKKTLEMVSQSMHILLLKRKEKSVMSW